MQWRGKGLRKIEAQTHGGNLWQLKEKQRKKQQQKEKQ